MEGRPFGRYRLVELIGRGGMGEVWRAHDTAIDRVVALKVLPANFADDEVFQERFRREAHAAAGLNEPHVIPIYDFGEIDGRLCVTMRLIEGRDLRSILAEGPLEPARAVKIIDQIASALHAAHRIGLVHRDVKPSNILLAEDDFAYLIDFGIAHAAGETGLTGTGNVIGSWAYMAPERLTSGQTDPRADIYALACVLVECLTGSQPYPGSSLEQQVTAHLTLPPPRPSTMHANVPAGLDAVIARGMAKNPDERYSTTKELASAAQAAITVPITRPHWMPPTEPVRHVEPQAELPPRPGSADDRQPRATGMSAPGGVSPTAPTRFGPASQPLLPGPVPQGARPPAPAKSRKGLRIALVSVGAVVVIVAVVVAVWLTSSGDRGEPAPAAKPPPAGTPALPNTGPFTGTFSADFGPLTDAAGKPGEPGFKDTWRLRSACDARGCVATASTGGQFPVTNLVFDDVGGHWLAVATSREKCANLDSERFDVVWLQPRPDGSMSGDWTIAFSQGCFSKRTVTFSRTGDTDVAALADPASQAPRVASPAEALHGRYHMERSYANGNTQEFDYGVRTDCLRTGERCMSFFVNPKGGGLPLVFGNGKWTYTQEADRPCASGGIAHVKNNMEYPLPQPLQDPITLLTGRGNFEVTGTACVGGDVDETFTRTGD